MARKRKGKNNGKPYTDRTEAESQNFPERGKGKETTRRKNTGRNRYSNNRQRNNGSGYGLASGLYATNEGTRNDLSWYTENPELIAVASRIAMPYRPGNKLSLGDVVIDPATTSPVTIHPELVIPGVMALDFTPTVGLSTDTESPASICAARMWAQIRSKFSSDLSADPADMFMYIYAIGNVHAYIEFLKRLYRTINTYFQDNYDYPKNVLIAQYPMMAGSILDTRFAELKNRRVELYTQINEMVNAINVFRVPDQYPILHRMRWMNMHIYLDENRANAQSYVFRQTCYYKLVNNDDTGTSLLPRPVNAGNTTLDELIALGWELITALQSWEDAYTINGYIARAWEGSSALIESYIAEYETISPVYVPEVLHQIENSNLCPIYYNGTTAVSITQAPLTGAIIHVPAGTINYDPGALILNSHDNTSDADTIIGTRLTSWFDYGTTDGMGVIMSGSEIISEIRLVWGGATALGNAAYQTNVVCNLPRLRNSAMTPEVAYDFMLQNHTLLSLEYWHHHPIVYVLQDYTHGWSAMAGTNGEEFRDKRGITPVFGLDNATLINREWLKNLHRIVFYSLYNVFSKDNVIGSKPR